MPLFLSLDIDDPSWSAIPGLEEKSRAAVAAALAAAHRTGDLEISLLYTDDAEITRLNADWRGKSAATNVLSFPAPDMPLPPGEAKPLGDIVLAAGVVAREAQEQGKSLEAHTLHLLIHGMLHLLGHDHVEDDEAETMEAMERTILAGLGIADPYAGER
jgi:probable rRNA maturation factor